MRNEGSYDDIVKIILIGDSGVGKTSFLNRFCYGSFKHNNPCTVGLEYGHKVIKVGQKKIMIQLWDTAGQERFKSITPSFYRSATAVILMFSVDNRESFNSIALWMKQINTFATQNIPVMLVCNKADLIKKQVSERESHSLADAYKLVIMMTSCEKNVNIQETIVEVCKFIKKTATNNLKLSKKEENNPNRKCMC